MKITRYFLWTCMTLAGTLFTGCQTGSETVPGPQSVKGMIAIRSQRALENETGTTSASVGETKSNDPEASAYTLTLEVWTREAEPRRMLRNTLNGDMDEGVQLEIALIPGIYDFLFWADYGNGRYLTTNLRQVTVVTDPYRPDARNDAFACAIKQVTWDGNTCNATLKRPMARINIHNTETFDQASAVSITYEELYTVYDVLTGEVSAPQQSLTVSFPKTTVGSTLIGEDFLFVPAEGVMSCSVSVDDVTKAIDDVPLKSNYNTNITSSF